MSDWRKVKFSDLCDITRGASPRPIIEWVSTSGIPWVKISDATSSDSRYITKTNEFIKSTGKTKSVEVFPEDFILSNSATPGIPRIMKINACIHDGWLLLRNFRDLDKNYCYYLLLSEREKLVQKGNGSVFTNLKTEILKNHYVTLPPLPEQRTIADVLSALDDKIELNRKMNATLESLAQALFKHTFLDNPEREKWKKGTIGNIVNVIDCLHSKKPERKEIGKPFLQLNNITNNGLLDISEIFFISEVDYKFWISRIEASPGDCVITNVGRVGAVSQIPDDFHAALGRNMTGLRCKPEYPFPTFLIECLLSSEMRREIENKIDTGTILDALNVKNIPYLTLSIPPRKLLEEFEEECRPLRKKMEINLQESRVLAELRDTLLPKLMSGQVRIT